MFDLVNLSPHEQLDAIKRKLIAYDKSVGVYRDCRYNHTTLLVEGNFVNIVTGIPLISNIPPSGYFIWNKSITGHWCLPETEENLKLHQKYNQYTNKINSIQQEKILLIRKEIKLANKIKKQIETINMINIGPLWNRLKSLMVKLEACDHLQIVYVLNQQKLKNRTEGDMSFCWLDEGGIVPSPDVGDIVFSENKSLVFDKNESLVWYIKDTQHNRQIVNLYAIVQARLQHIEKQRNHYQKRVNRIDNRITKAIHNEQFI